MNATRSRPAGEHRCDRCRDEACPRLACRAFRDGHRDGYEAGFADGFAAGASAAAK